MNADDVTAHFYIDYDGTITQLQSTLDLDLPDVDVVPDPMADLSPDARRTARARTAIANGIHPFGVALRVGTGETCRTCAHARRIGHHSRHFWKCDATRGDTASAASDLRLWWPACLLYEPRTDG